MKNAEISHISTLLSHFMDGTSTLDEERILAQYFRTEQVPDEWLAYKEMFAWFDEGMPEPAKLSVVIGWKKYRRWAGVAAVVALVAWLGWPHSSNGPGRTEIPEQQAHQIVAEAEMVKPEPVAEPKVVAVARQKPSVRPTSKAPVAEVCQTEPDPVENPSTELREEREQLLAELKSLAHDEMQRRQAIVETYFETRGYKVVSQQDNRIDLQPIADNSNYICL